MGTVQFDILSSPGLYNLIFNISRETAAGVATAIANLLDQCASPALLAGWHKAGSERFVMDIARDALWVMDYLSLRPDVLQD